MTPIHELMQEASRELHGAFGTDTFGRRAESFARFFGTPQFLIGQTVMVVGWVMLNALALTYRWDPYPFILLNLAFSLQAAYAAPLILLAQTRQADRDKSMTGLEAAHREELAASTLEALRKLNQRWESVLPELRSDADRLASIEITTRKIHAAVSGTTA